jgi:hypothetical protein
VTKLSRRRLEWLVRARGTDLAAWPEAERLAAIALLRSSPDARKVFADALVAEAAPENDCVVIERMQAALRRSLAPLPLLMRGLRAGALAACVVAGVYLATTLQPDPDPTTDVFTSAQTLSLAALDQ